MEGIEAAILKLKEEQQETYNKLLAKERLVEREVGTSNPPVHLSALSHALSCRFQRMPLDSKRGN